MNSDAHEGIERHRVQGQFYQCTGAAGMNDDVGSGLLKVQVWSVLGSCLCFPKRLCLNAGGGGGGGVEGGEGGGGCRNAPTVGKKGGDDLGV